MSAHGAIVQPPRARRTRPTQALPVFAVICGVRGGCGRARPCNMRRSGTLSWTPRGAGEAAAPASASASGRPTAPARASLGRGHPLLAQRVLALCTAPPCRTPADAPPTGRTAQGAPAARRSRTAITQRRYRHTLGPCPGRPARRARAPRACARMRPSTRAPLENAPPASSARKPRTESRRQRQKQQSLNKKIDGRET